ncbi:hypothetical protein GCM10023186_19400 [Hymenobacter koreensis]|uniref:Uncharacterized protein n=1 Tax=Hymenobacter koreensis TaxID=1084523 RepID=A0ABP8IZJ8_9BACT
MVVPDMADSTTMRGSLERINSATARMRAAEPTDVPPNLRTFMEAKEGSDMGLTAEWVAQVKRKKKAPVGGPALVILRQSKQGIATVRSGYV